MLGLISPSRLVLRSHHCQRADILGDHTLIERIRSRVENGLGIRSGIARVLHPEPPQPTLGAPSRFAVGDWVRVLDRDALATVLDANHKTRGLLFTDTQFDFAGRVMRVSAVVRRMRNDRRGYRPVYRTVLLDGADCGGLQEGLSGCGRACPLMFRDEWLVPAEAADVPVPIAVRRHALVRSYDQIIDSLDMFGRRDGVTFMPEMRAYTGKRFPILTTVPKVYEYDGWCDTRGRLFVLDGLYCAGEICGTDGPCDRRCRLVWHADWLDLDPEGT